MTSWTGKIKAALQGDVDGADALARLAAGAPLAGLRQQLADRRLEAEIANAGEEWRVPDALAPAAAPLWLAEALVGLAQALCDAEASEHPDRPAAMVPLVHGQVLALLEPLDALQTELSSLLADPGRRSALALPMLARPYTHSGAGLMSDHIPPPYLRGLLDGVINLGGAVQMLLDDYRRLVQGAAAPRWLVDGYAVLAGDLAAAQTRLEAVRGRAEPLLHHQQPDENTLRSLAIDLWQTANTYLKIGQTIAAPSLMPGAQPLPLRIQAAAGPAPTVAPSNAPMPPRVTTPPQAPPIPAAPQPSAPPAGDRQAQAAAAPSGPPTPPQVGPRADQVAAPTGPGGAWEPPPQSPPAAPGGPGVPAPAAGRHVERGERWLLSARPARHRLRAAGAEEQAERDLAAFWEAKGWTLTATEARYLVELAAAVARGAVAPSGRSMAACPFAPIYRVIGGVQVLDRPLSPGTLFSYEHQPGGRGMVAGLSPQAGIPDAP